MLQIKQVCDRLADAGFLVAAPDVFQGKPWPMSKMPPKPEDNLHGWISTEGSYEKVSKHIAKTVEHLKSKGAESFGIIGFCWGASIAMKAAAEGLVSACVIVHPSLFGK